jgi:hypothetical protein
MGISAFSKKTQEIGKNLTFQRAYKLMKWYIPYDTEDYEYIKGTKLLEKMDDWTKLKEGV